MYLRKLSIGKKRIAFGVLLLVIAVGIFAVSFIERREVSLPPPTIACPVTLDWKTIMPGISTRQEVVDVLRKPDEKGKVKFIDGKVITYYAYDVEGGIISEYDQQHRIFFRSGGRVDWIEVIVADQDGGFHTIRETVDQLGNTLDTVYTNNNYNPFVEFQYDVLYGPDQVLVWSECGLAMVAVWGMGNTEEQTDSRTQVLTLRFQPEIELFYEPVTNLSGVVMMKFLFQPTAFEGFRENYMYRIPYSLWDEYFAKVRSR